MGLVTCSSTMSGLRSQREYTITWVSPRSGIASTGMCSIDHTPHAHAIATSRKISALLRAEKPMSRSIMSFRGLVRRTHCHGRFLRRIVRRLRKELLTAGVRAEAVLRALVVLLECDAGRLQRHAAHRVAHLGPNG